MSGWHGTEEEKATADRKVAPWVRHTHFPWNITEGPLTEKMANLRNAGYEGYYSVEHHSGRNEYAEVGIQLAKVQRVYRGLADPAVSVERFAGTSPFGRGG